MLLVLRERLVVVSCLLRPNRRREMLCRCRCCIEDARRHTEGSRWHHERCETAIVQAVREARTLDFLFLHGRHAASVCLRFGLEDWVDVLDWVDVSEVDVCGVDGGGGGDTMELVAMEDEESCEA
jgi:hypothetical protein